jgi:hypothetical protein
MNIKTLLLPIAAISTLFMPMQAKTSSSLLTPESFRVMPVSLPVSTRETEEADATMFTLHVMGLVRSPLSMAKRLRVARVIGNVAVKVFDSVERRKDWIVLLGMESQFNQSARSKKGAMGIGQIMPRFAKEFANLCGLRSANLQELEVNAHMSACLFNNLARDMQGTHLALVAYNAGKNSQDVRRMQELRNINPQTANYISKFAYVREGLEALLRIKTPYLSSL